MEVSVARVTVGKRGRHLAIRVPVEIAKAARLSAGEQVEIATHDGDIVIRRPVAQARANAQAAVEEIIGESRKHSLGKIAIRELIDEGRRG
jgi:antitoxin MazE